MTTFVNAVQNANAPLSRTTNGMKAFATTTNANVDLFYNIGAMRGKDIVPVFSRAFAENDELAVRIALWARDVRSGAGERQTFRNILKWLANNHSELLARVAARVPDLGRWDDLLELLDTDNGSQIALNMFDRGLNSTEFKSQRGLVAKWLPRQGVNAARIRNHLKMAPRAYRKMLVNATAVVETKMCAREWNAITYDHVPSVAAARYQKAFNKHDPAGYSAYREALKRNDGSAKVNAGAVYPYDVIRSVAYGDASVAEAQWNALPNFVGDASILPMVDVSGSMTCRAGGYMSKSDVTCLDVATSLGLYLADKNKGKFKDLFLTFSTQPELLHLKGSLLQKLRTMKASNWSMSTDLHAAFDLVLRTAVSNRVPQAEMPQTLLIISDMQFNSCVRFDDNAHQMITRKYAAAGYDAPRVVFWNVNAANTNAPVTAGAGGVALVSGFSPSIVKSVLNGKNFTPEGIMLETVTKSRYDF